MDHSPAVESQLRRRQVVDGARAMIPWLLGVAPFGLVIGVTAAKADIPALAGWLTGPLIFGGSAQVATIQLLDRGAAPGVVIAAALALNARLVLYSATMAPHWRDAPRRWQALYAYGLIDPSFAVGVAGYEHAADPRDGHRHYLGAVAALWVTWVGAITLGFVAGSTLPASLHLEFVIPLFLVGEIIPRLTSRAARCGTAAAAALAVAGTVVPLHLGPLVAIVGGTAIALASDGRAR